MDIHQYAGTYSDAVGLEPIVLMNDGAKLSTEIRGVKFSGPDFDRLRPVAAGPELGLRLFELNNNELCACTLTVEIPVPIVTRQAQISGVLHASLELGLPNARGGIDSEMLRLTLKYGDQQNSSRGLSGWFEDELLDLQRQMPEGEYIKACINCLYSDYSPYGHGLFGCMMCFRNLKAEYLSVKSKDDLWGVHGREDRMVQETFLCPEFVRRVPGTGYRG